MVLLKLYSGNTEYYILLRESFQHMRFVFSPYAMPLRLPFPPIPVITILLIFPQTSYVLRIKSIFIDSLEISEYLLTISFASVNEFVFDNWFNGNASADLCFFRNAFHAAISFLADVLACFNCFSSDISCLRV